MKELENASTKNFGDQVTNLEYLEIKKQLGENGLNLFKSVVQLMNDGAQLIEVDGKTMIVFSTEQSKNLVEADKRLNPKERAKRNAESFLDNDYKNIIVHLAEKFDETFVLLDFKLNNAFAVLNKNDKDEKTIKEINNSINLDKALVVETIAKNIQPIYELAKSELEKLVDLFLNAEGCSVRVKNEESIKPFDFEFMYVNFDKTKRGELCVSPRANNEYGLIYVPKREIALNNADTLIKYLRYQDVEISTASIKEFLSTK